VGSAAPRDRIDDDEWGLRLWHVPDSARGVKGRG
jgi:hypothetical protein